MNDKEKTSIEKLIGIQNELKAPKNQYNSFSKFYYRSCEDILQAVKPLLEKEKLFLTLDDEPVAIQERYYIKATATIRDINGKDVAITHGYAREDDIKKGMDGSQITGTASSYARKYCLNAMFLIDDTKDADTDEYRSQTDNKKAPAKTNNTQSFRFNAEEAKAKLEKMNSIEEVRAYYQSVSHKLTDEQKAELEKLCKERKTELEKEEK